MASKFETWRQKMRQRIRQHPIGTMVIFVLLIVLIILIVAVILSVLSNGTGFNGYTVKSTATETTLSPQTKVTTTTQSQPGKTLWDWLQLLIVPLVLAIGGLWFSQMQKTLEQRRTTDNQREAALQSYIDKISELLLNGNLAERTADDQLNPEYKRVCLVARVRTITVLTQLDARRIGYVFAFLREAELMSVTKDVTAISLKNADLHAVDWSQADLRGVNLSGANLSGAIFSSITFVPRVFGGTIIIPNRADLRGADLSRANLRGADLNNVMLLEANLSEAILDGANLSKATVTPEQLAKAKSLKGATMPDGSIHP